MECSPPGSSVHEISQEEYWSGLPLLSREIFPTQGLNMSLLLDRWILYHLVTKRALYILIISSLYVQTDL